MDGYIGRQKKVSGRRIFSLHSCWIKNKAKQSEAKHLSALMNIHVFSQWKYSFSVTFPQNHHIVFFLVGSVVNFIKIYS